MAEKKFLQDITFFQNLNAKQREFVARYIEIKSFSADESIIKQGNPGDGLFMIRTGSVIVTSTLPGDHEIKLAVLSDGDFLGEVMLVEKGLATASVRATSDTDCYFLSTKYFDMLRLSQPLSAHLISESINKIACDRLRLINKQIAGKLTDIVEYPEQSTSTPVISEMKCNRKIMESIGLDCEFLMRLDTFTPYTEREFETLVSYMKLITLPRDFMLFREGDPSGTMFTVVEGTIQISIAKDDKITKLGIHAPGDLFGQFSFVDELPRSTTAVTREASILMVIDTLTMARFQDEEPLLFYRWYYTMSQALVSTLRFANKQLIRAELI